MLFANASGCETITCNNTPAGWYYTPVDKERRAYLDTLECPVANCTPPTLPDRRFVPGFATESNACPTEQCDMSTLPIGHYFQLTNNYTECTAAPCELLPGYFYLHSAQGGPDGCAKVRSKCTNTQLGEEYAPQTELVTNKSECPVQLCSDPDVGKDFAIQGSCAPLVSCTTAGLGQYYVKSPATNPCQLANCINAREGQFYPAGAVNLGPKCAVRRCSIISGYSFRTRGDCLDMERCPVPDAGFYYTDSPDETCKQRACHFDRRGTWKFVPGFALRRDKCPRKKCARAGPYASLDSCDPRATTTTTTNIFTTPRVAFVADSVKSKASGMATKDIVVIAAAASGAVIFVVVLTLLIWCCVKRRNAQMQKQLLFPSGSRKTSTYATEPTKTEASGQTGDGKAHTIAASAVSNIKWGDLMLNPDDVTLGRKLAQGAGGQIFMGRFTDCDVALKESYDMLMNEHQDELVREAGMMLKLTHHNIVRFFGIWQPEDATGEETGRVFLVMELCPNGDLRDAAQNPDSSLLQRQQWITQVASAMQYLHGRTPPIIHRDLKPQNVLLDAKGNAKVCDFGTSKVMESSRDMTVGVGTVAYMAPEMMRAFSENSTGAEIDGTKCDVFSFAILALYVATGEAPYAGLDNQDIFLKIGMRGGRTAIPPGYAGTDNEHGKSYERFVGFVKRMWQQQPEDRPEFQVIVEELENCFDKTKSTLHI